MISLGAIIVCFSALLVTLILHIGRFSYWKRRNVPFITPVPIFGNISGIFFMKCNIAEQLLSLYRKSKEPIVGIFMLQRPALLVRDADLIKKIFMENSDYFYNRSVSQSIDEERDPDRTTGLASGKDDMWKFVRKEVTPGFSPLRVKTMMDDIDKCGHKLKKYLLQLTMKNEEIEVRNVNVRYAIEAACAVFFGIDAKCFVKEDSPYILLEKNLFDYRVFSRGFQAAMFFISPVISRICRLKFIDDSSAVEWMKLINKYIEERRNGSIKRYDYLSILIDAMEHYQGKGNLLGASIEVFVAAYETVASSLSFASYELATNMDMQKKLRKELQLVMDGEQHVSIEHLNQMPYLDIFTKELWRLYPITAFLDRICKREFVLENPKIVIDEGITVYVSTLGLHKNPEFYPDPTTFRPERFLENINWEVYFPFGKGPRICPAKKYSELSVKTAIVNLLLNFEVNLSPRSPPKMTFHTKGFSLQPAGDVNLLLHPIN